MVPNDGIRETWLNFAALRSEQQARFLRHTLLIPQRSGDIAGD